MRIQIQIGDETPQSYTIEKNELVIGSSKKADITIPVPAVSRQHLTLINEEGKFFIVDNGSTNGTWLNQEKIGPNQKREFETGFTLRLANQVTLILVNEDETNEAMMKTSTSHKIFRPSDLISEKSQEKKVTTTELLLDLDVPHVKAKEKARRRQVKVEAGGPEIESDGGLGKGVITLLILAAVGYYVYQTFVK